MLNDVKTDETKQRVELRRIGVPESHLTAVIIATTTTMLLLLTIIIILIIIIIFIDHFRTTKFLPQILILLTL